MALKLIANYSKRLGLPGYSSHQFSVCVETEIINVDDVAGESACLYQTLQQSVDDQIRQTGFVPDNTYGLDGKKPAPTNGRSNGNGRSNDHTNGNANRDVWTCSDKQRDLILQLVDEHGLDKNAVEDLSHDMFSVGVKELNKLQASGLIDRILEDHGQKPNRPRNRTQRRTYQNGGAR